MILHGAIGLTYDIYRNLRRKLVDDHALIRGTQVVLMVMAVIATILSLNPPAFIAVLATYVFGLFGAAFIAPMYFGLYWKRANRQGAYASSILGAGTYVILSILASTGMLVSPMPPIILAIVLSVLTMVLCTLAFPAAPREAWEPYFEPTISPSTRAAIDRAMKSMEKVSGIAAPAPTPAPVGSAEHGASD